MNTGVGDAIDLGWKLAAVSPNPSQPRVVVCTGMCPRTPRPERTQTHTRCVRSARGPGVHSGGNRGKREGRPCVCVLMCVCVCVCVCVSV
jgi:hypothetical protein